MSMSAIAHPVECSRQLSNQSVRHSPKYWGRWFTPIGDGDMKETNLNIFYRLGGCLDYLMQNISFEMEVQKLYLELILPQDWLKAFLSETEEFTDALRHTRASASALLDAVQTLIEQIPRDWERKITQPEVLAIRDWKEEFERNFERETPNLDVFTVTPKGIYSTRLLIERAEEKFQPQTRSVFSARVIYDLRQSGRCLAFEVPTAMAFHVMRATESLIKSYYQALAKQPWSHTQRDWGRYILELEKLPGVSKVITSRLTEIQKLNRNPLIHPEEIVPLEEAPVIYDLCNGVIYYMADEIGKLGNKSLHSPS